MGITLNSSYSQYNLRNNNYQCKKPNFTANPQNVAANIAEDVAEKLSNNSSKFFEPFTKMFGKTSEWLCKTVAKPVLGSRWFGKFAEVVRNSGDRLFQHCLTVGSVITSGLYMQRTLTNDKLDKDRKQTLAVNQFLTLGVSTAGAYLLDDYLKEWWENVSARYVGLRVADSNFDKDFKDTNKAISAINKNLKSNPTVDLDNLIEQIKTERNLSDDSYNLLKDTVKGAKKAALEDGDKLKKIKPVKLNKFIEKMVKKGRIAQLPDKLSKQLKGLGFLRSMIVFGFVYRYFVPVAVTKPANKLCDMYLERKKSKQEQKAKNA